MNNTQTNTHTLTHHRDIRSWVSDRRGMPAIARERTGMGELRSKLCLSFERKRRSAVERVKLDDGMAPCSWSAWLAELDRQHLALKVSPSGDFEFVDRREMNN